MFAGDVLNRGGPNANNKKPAILVKSNVDGSRYNVSKYLQKRNPFTNRSENNLPLEDVAGAGKIQTKTSSFISYHLLELLAYPKRGKILFFAKAPEIFSFFHRV